MPYVNVNLSTTLKQEQKTQVKAKIGELISLIPGKEEESTMVSVVDNYPLYFGGKEMSNGAFIDVRIFGSTEQKNKEVFTAAVFDALEKLLGISKNDIYMNIFEMSNWGVRGKFV
ncbi:MAG: phenylpyruvate tautomerase MIF-related protein [Christensenellales bacterium]|jgi:phenylpyruvate tautomerase PptA (4-oxalocrotonate tautomerase family)